MSQEKIYKLMISVWILNYVLFYINVIGSQTRNNDTASFQLTNIININIYVILMTRKLIFVWRLWWFQPVTKNTKVFKKQINVNAPSATGRHSITKVLLHKEVLIPKVRYAHETWTTYRWHLNTAEKFHQHFLRNILNTSWKDRRTNVSVLNDVITTSS